MGTVETIGGGQGNQSLVDVSKESGQEAAEMPMYRGTLRIERVELIELKDHIMKNFTLKCFDGGQEPSNN